MRKIILIVDLRRSKVEEKVWEIKAIDTNKYKNATYDVGRYICFYFEYDKDKIFA